MKYYYNRMAIQNGLDLYSHLKLESTWTIPRGDIGPYSE